LQQKIEFEFELDFRESTPTRAMRTRMILGSDKMQALSEMISIPWPVYRSASERTAGPNGSGPDEGATDADRGGTLAKGI
jgi:hypothetical protein